MALKNLQQIITSRYYDYYKLTYNHVNEIYIGLQSTCEQQEINVLSVDCCFGFSNHQMPSYSFVTFTILPCVVHIQSFA